jgi:mono/diheme cytochrome c family protein
MLKSRIVIVFIAIALVATAYLALSAQTASSQQKANPDMKAQMVKRGGYLVSLGGCNDCHSPKIFTPQGPMPDTTRALSGAPADLKVPEVPASVLGPDKWGFVGSNDMTAWGGPWGVSFAANLTPDQVTGCGAWTEAAFIKAMRTGKHLGAGRDIMPPMPWQAIGQLPDDDLKAIFAYMKSIKPVENMVHLPIPPTAH